MARNVSGIVLIAAGYGLLGFGQGWRIATVATAITLLACTLPKGSPRRTPAPRPQRQPSIHIVVIVEWTTIGPYTVMRKALPAARIVGAILILLAVASGASAQVNPCRVEMYVLNGKLIVCEICQTTPGAAPLIRCSDR